MFPIARVGDPVTHDQNVPSGAITGPGVPTVLIEGQPAARMGDMATCTGAVTGAVVHPPQGPPPLPPPMPVAKASAKILVGGQPACRWLVDVTGCGAFVGDARMAAARKVSGG